MDDYLVIDFSKDNKKLVESLSEIFGDEIKEDILESKKFNGDVVNIVATILIPVGIPFLTALFEKYLERNTKKIEPDKSVTMSFGGKKFYFHNVEVDEIKTILKEVRKHSK